MNPYIVVEHLSDLNEQIQKPIQQSQRIKFNCFNVSKNHIIFGASSGGIYIYKRKPCNFLKIVPTKEGAIDQISVSDDESFMAVSNQKGLIIIIENCFTGDIKFQIYNHHNNGKITILKWHLHELYSGDINGKVCVTSFKNILSKSIFQTPSATLMHLDSPIVQIDCHLQYLLISTLTKTLFCDTAQEQYKQIGRKARDGPHGACFQTPQAHICESQINITDEPQSFEAANDRIAIFCSRPGLRIWQVEFNTSVVCTHQFKNAKPLGKNIYKISGEKNCRAIKDNIQLKSDNDKTTNFYRIHRLSSNLMLTFNDNVVYTFSVTETKVTLLYKLLFDACIQDIRILDNDFYVLLETWSIRCYSIFDLESFILYAMNMEQFLLCADICVDFKVNVYEIYEKSEHLHVLSTLKLNLELIQELNLLDDLKDLFEFIYSKQELLTLRRTNIGPVTLQNCYSEEVNGSANGIHLSSDIETIPENQFDNTDFCVTAIIKQYKFDVQYHVDYPDYTKLVEHKSIFEMMNLIECIITEDREFDLDHKDLIKWCYKQFLILLKNNNAVSIDAVLKDYTLKCFRNINEYPDKICRKCKYPLPTAKDVIPNYYHLICDIFKEDRAILREVATEIPYVWKCLLECDVTSVSINNLLPIIIQFSDIAVLEQCCNKLNYDLWDEAVNLMIKIKSKRCLYCDNILEFDISSTMSWQSFANVAMRTMSPISVLKLFKARAAFIRNTELGPEFYQNLIFVAAMDSTGKNTESTTQIFQSAMVDNSQKIEIEGSLAKYLNNGFLQRNNHSHVDLSPINSLKNILCNKL